MAGLIISVLTNKGGTGKTTTSVNLGQGLAREGKKVLVVDNDSQCNATTILLNSEPDFSLYDIYSGNNTDIKDCISYVEFQPNLFCLPNQPDTASAEPGLILKGLDGGAFITLRQALRDYARDNFDFTLIDNPPNHGIFAINSLYTSDFAIVPTEAGSKASVIGLLKAVQFIDDIRSDESGNPDLKFLRLLITKVDRRTSICKVITSQLKENFGQDNMFDVVIPINTALQKAELLDQTIFKFDPKAGGAQAYRKLAKELISIFE